MPTCRRTFSLTRSVALGDSAAAWCGEHARSIVLALMYAQSIIRRPASAPRSATLVAGAWTLLLVPLGCGQRAERSLGRCRVWWRQDMPVSTRRAQAPHAGADFWT